MGYAHAGRKGARIGAAFRIHRGMIATRATFVKNRSQAVAGGLFLSGIDMLAPLARDGF